MVKNPVKALLLTRSPGVNAMVQAAATKVAHVHAVAPGTQEHVAAAAARWQTLLLDFGPESRVESVILARLAREAMPRPTVVGIAALSRDGELPIFSAEAACLSDVVLVDVDDTIPLIRAHLRDESRSGALATTLRLLCRTLAPKAYELSKAVVERMGSRSSVSNVAGLLASTRWGFRRSTIGCMGIGPAEFIDWCRLIAACALAERSAWSLNRIGKYIGYADPRAFRTASTGLLGRLPQDLRCASAALTAACRMEARIATARKRKPDHPRARRSHKPPAHVVT